jgi:23S rRNA (adenine2503-C2)-methyltransferase
MVNLIPMNPVIGTSFAAPRRETVVAFQAILDAAGVTTTVRVEKGREIQAACGQLRGKHPAPQP